MTHCQARVWLITGCSKGLGRALAEAVLAHGDCVVATARNPAALAGLGIAAPERMRHLALDVTRESAVEEAIENTITAFGSVDVLVNNAGYGLAGAVEEISDAEVRAQMETNLYGALNMTRAVLPDMRRRGRGHILQISSVAGFAATAGLGIYNASKFALEGFSEALALELAPLGIKVTIVEPGPFRTDWAGPSLAIPAMRIEAYAETAHKTIATLNGYAGQQPGDPAKAAAAMIAVVESATPPLRLPLGELALSRVRAKLAAMNRELSTWEALSLATSFDQ